MASADQSLLADLADFPLADDAAWRALVAKSLDGQAPDEALARPGEDGHAVRPLATEADLPEHDAAPTTWRAGRLANVVSVQASNANQWSAAVDAELAAGATGVTSALLPAGAEARASELLAAGHALLLGARPSQPVTGAWILAHDPISAALEARHLAKLEATFAAGLGLQLEARGEGRRHGLVDLGFYARAGATGSQELGLLAATLAESARHADARGVAAREHLAGLAIALDLTTDVFASVAKLRAARVVWSKVLAAHGVASDPAPWILARAGERTWSALDAETNWIRGSLQGTAAFLGGADAFANLPHDLCLAGTSSRTGLRTARDTQSVLGLEGHLDRVADPARGSYHIEAETDRLARDGWSFFQHVERQGGLLRALSIGSVAAPIASSREERHARLASGAAKLVGVTAFRRKQDGAAHAAEPTRGSEGWNLERESEAWEATR